MKPRSELFKLFILVLSVILIAAGLVNLKNYQLVFSPFDFSYASFFLPLVWMISIAVGGYLFVKYIKMELR